MALAGGASALTGLPADGRPHVRWLARKARPWATVAAYVDPGTKGATNPATLFIEIVEPGCAPVANRVPTHALSQPTLVPVTVPYPHEDLRDTVLRYRLRVDVDGHTVARSDILSVAVRRFRFGA